MDTQDEHFAVGDAILVVGTDDDGKVGTILRRTGDDEYLVALEDGVEVRLRASDLSHRH
jgi:hypothetical protein